MELYRMYRKDNDETFLYYTFSSAVVDAYYWDWKQYFIEVIVDDGENNNYIKETIEVDNPTRDWLFKNGVSYFDLYDETPEEVYGE